MTEIWKDVVGYEGLYQVSNTGKIKSLKLNREVFKNRIVKGKGNKDGYVHCLLMKNGKVKQKYLHKLIAEAFIPNSENKPQVDHINCNSLDNRVENLRWCDQKENNNNPITRLRQQKGYKVKCVDLGLSFYSIREAARRTHTSLPSIIYGIKNNKKYGKFTWELIGGVENDN